MASSSGNVNVVGGGIAGLIAAIELVRAGAKVTLFESAADLGGRARTKYADGFMLNQGPHALYITGAFKRELDRLGIPYSGLKTTPLEPQGLYRGKLYRLPTSASSLMLSNLFSVGEKLAYAGVQKAVIDGATGKESFAVWLDGQDLSPLVRMAMESIARVSSYANGSSLTHAAAMLDQIRRGLKGVIYVDGGWAALVGELAKAAQEAGAVLKTGAAAERVAVEGLRSRVTLADGSEHLADATLLALGPKEAARLAPSVGSLGGYAEDAIPVRTNTLDLALEELPDGARQFALGIDQPFYFSVHSIAAKLAPEGGAVVHVAKYLPPDETPGHDAIAELEAVADLAMPGWRRFEKKRQELRGMAVTNAFVRADKPRPGVALLDAPGLFVAGDWVGDEGMLSDASAASAVEAAAHIAGMLERERSAA
ncbi:MAG: FAD-dependent oxidoreductase [Hyphomonadaceae bacterium]|nr:FAD-dependent oxidoreductase [Hyphomonadaceae bacterium]